jgi:hypothetical protein
MKTRILTIVAGAALLAGCSASNPLDQFVRNLTAADCSTPAAEQAFVSNLPPVLFVTPAQQLAVLGQLCAGMFGTVAAPPTAPGNTPAIPVPTAVVPATK